MPFPRNGSITSHSICGADITNHPSQAADAFIILDAVAKQVEAILKAQQTSSGPGVMRL
jgi:hypothetical protein